MQTQCNIVIVVLYIYICYSCVDGSINNRVNAQTHNGMTFIQIRHFVPEPDKLPVRKASLLQETGSM